MKRIIISIFLFITVISAQWSTDPAAPQSLGSGVQTQLAATSDGGVYVAWLSDGNNYHVYLQRLNSLGEPQLGNNGMVVSNNANASWIAVFHLNLAVDSEDNAIITTVDQRTGGQWEVYAYKIAPDGSMLWGDDGVALTAASMSNMSPRLTVLPDNSVVVTWTHNDNTVLFQRLSTGGTLMWGTGILIVDNNANLISPQPIVTGEGDVLIQWIRQTGPSWPSNSELYLQKYDYDGIAQWSNPILAAGPVVFPMGNWSQQSVFDANIGSFSAWTEMSGSVQSAAVQHINGDGTLSWAGGVDLSTNFSNFRMSPMLTVGEETQELMAVWREANGSQSQRGVYAQRLDSNGDRLWGNNGTAVVGLNNNYDYLDLSVAGFGDDLIAAYIEQSVNTNGDIYAVRLDASGNDFWDSGTVTVTNSSSPKSDMMISKGPDCLFIAWTENGSVYIHCLREDGTLGAPDTGGVLLVPSEYPTIQAAIDSANDGDMVLVMTGTYVENINYNGKNISVIGTDRETTIIDGNQAGSVVTFESGEDSSAVLTGFTIQNGSNFNGGGIYCLGSSPTIVYCTITGNSAVEGGGIKCGNSSSPTITNCTISGNTASGNGGGICCPNSLPVITNCTITGNIAVEGGGIFSYFSSETITNCILWNNSPGEIAVSSGDGPTASYSDIQGGYEGTGNIDADPLFCNPDSGDYTLAGISPCIGTGENGVNMGAFGVGCGIQVDWDFSLSEPVIEVMGADNEWNPGDTISVEMEFCNNTNVAHNWYPGVTIESDSSLTSLHIGHIWFYAMVADECHTISWSAIANTSIISDTIVEFRAYPEALNCQSQPEYCIDGDTLTFEVPIVVQVVSTEPEHFIPEEFVLHQNYPNPFNPFTTLRYDLPENGYVNIIIYDMLGREVKTLINETQDAGYRSVIWNATNDYGNPVSAGVYLYKIQAEGFVQTKKMVLLK